MTDLIHRAGAAGGLPPVGLSRALRVGVLVGWTNAAASLRDPAHRPIGLMWALLTVVAGGFGWILAGSWGAFLGAGVGFLGYFAVIMLLGMLIEPLLFVRAARVWLIDGPERHGCAKAVELGDGAWRLTSVAVWPFGRGIATALTEAVTADADLCQRVVRLTAENRRVGSLYERFGFTYARQGRHEMLRDPVTASDQTTAPS